MKIQSTIILLAVFVYGHAQSPGDQLFNTNQVVTVGLQFSQASFWDSLVAYYETETYMPADVTITDNSGTYTFDDIGVRLKGNSSYGHPGEKKSFKIDFNRYIDSLNYDDLVKINFNNCFKDPTFMREKIIYDICKAENINAPRANYANVYMNDTFWGFYEIAEQVDDALLKTRFDDQSENLFKAGDAFGMGAAADEADLLFYGASQEDYTDKYTLENNTDENNWSDLIDLLDFINNSSDAEFSSGLSEHFNVEQLMKSFVLYNLFANLDSYINSARNYYIYNKDSAGVWEWINWDCNEAFGSYTGGPGMDDLTELDIYYYTDNRPLLERIMSNTTTKEQYTTYYCDMKATYFNDSYIDSMIDNLYSLIQAHVYADDQKMYSNEDFENNLENDIILGGGPGGGTIYGLRSFVEERNNYLEDVLYCAEANNISDQVDETQLLIYPNPADDHIYVVGTFSGSTVTVRNIQGDMIKVFEFNAPALKINILDLAAGYYYVQLNTSGGVLTKPFIKN